MKPKILVGCPTSFHKEYCLKQYIKAITTLTYQNYNILIVENSKDNTYFNKLKSLNIPVIKGRYFESARQRITTSRNILRQHTLDNNYDYFLSLEQDIIPPKDIIECLLSHNKDVITAIYFARNILESGKVKLIPLVYFLNNPKDQSLKPIDNYNLWTNPRLIKIDSCGLGCILIHRNVLKKIKFRYDEEYESFDDRYFCKDLNKNNISLYSDTSIKCKHFILNRPYQWKTINK